MLERVRIVLINTSHPGNIGSVARAMKTMGLVDLYLVQPKLFPHIKANELASGALDVLHQAKVVSTLEEAIADCTLVIGTSARSRKIPWPLLSPKEVAQKVGSESVNSKIALVFGREDMGLSNEELHRCHAHVQIPANPAYSSLNLAAAVQVIAYELYEYSLLSAQSIGVQPEDLATSDEMEQFFTHLQKVLIEIDFLKPSAPRQLMARMRRFFLRSRPEKTEMNILRGWLTAIETVKKRSNKD